MRMASYVPSVESKLIRVRPFVVQGQSTLTVSACIRMRGKASQTGYVEPSGAALSRRPRRAADPTLGGIPFARICKPFRNRGSLFTSNGQATGRPPPCTEIGRVLLSLIV